MSRERLLSYLDHFPLLEVHDPIRVSLHRDPNLGNLVHGAGKRPGARGKRAASGAREVLDQGTLCGR
jgi:hypothetical protein